MTTKLSFSQAFLKGFFKLQPAYRYDGVQQLVGRSMAILEAHELVKKIEKLLYQTTEKGVKVKTILESFEPVIVGTCPLHHLPSFHCLPIGDSSNDPAPTDPRPYI